MKASTKEATFADREVHFGNLDRPSTYQTTG